MGLCALEAEVAGALEGEFAVVAFDEVAVVLGGDRKLHAVAAGDLERGVVPGGGGIRACGAVMVVGDVHALGDDGRVDGQARGVVILVPTADAAHGGDDEHDEDADEHDREDHGEDRIHKVKAEHSGPSLSVCIYNISDAEAARKFPAEKEKNLWKIPFAIFHGVW